MPIFDFICTTCQHGFEALASASRQVVCPACGGTQLQKQVSSPSAPGKSAGIIARGRAAADKAGHFSHYRRQNGRPVD